MTDDNRLAVTRELPPVGELEGLVRFALAEAGRAGADAAEVSASSSRGLAVKVRRGEVDTLEHMRDRGLGVTVYFGQRKASASSADYGEAAIRETVRAACEIARHTSADPCAGLADPEHLARAVPDLDLYHPWDVTPEAAIERARECEAAALAVDPRLTNSEGAELSSGEAVNAYGNSHGFVGGFRASQHGLGCVVVGREGEQMQREHWFTTARAPADLEAAAAVGREAGERTARRLGARRLATTSAPVLFAAPVARSLIGHFVGAVSGGSLYRRASFLVDSLGTQVFPAFVSMDEQPHLPRGLGSAPFDAEGVATRPRRLVADGVLQGYVLSSYSARQLGMTTTGNAGGVHNLTVSGGERAFGELLRDMHRGLLVTQLMGQGANPVTGDYSRGAAGYWVEDGAIAYPVEEITVAGNLRDIYRNLAAVGTDVDRRGSVHCGSLLVEGLTIAGE